jgi:FMN phosphatase YigB (HAD superfamily)
VKRYSTVFLDWNKTLSHSRFWGHWQDINHPHNHIFKNIQAILFSNPSDPINDWMRGKYNTEQIIDFLATTTHQDYQLLLSEFIKSCQEMKYSTSQIPLLVKRLRAKGVKVIIATDNMDSFTRWTVPALQLDKVFDDVLNSYDLHVLKTDTDNNGESKFFKSEYIVDHLSKNLLIDDILNMEQIVKKSKIDFLHVTQETKLEKYLEQLLNS